MWMDNTLYLYNFSLWSSPSIHKLLSKTSMTARNIGLFVVSMYRMSILHLANFIRLICRHLQSLIFSLYHIHHHYQHHANSPIRYDHDNDKKTNESNYHDTTHISHPISISGGIILFFIYSPSDQLTVSLTLHVSQQPSGIKVTREKVFCRRWGSSWKLRLLLH